MTTSTMTAGEVTGAEHALRRYRERREQGFNPADAIRKVVDLATRHPLDYDTTQRCGERDKASEYQLRISENVIEGSDLVSAYWYWGKTMEMRIRASEARGGVL